jgi:hypothetical protein
VSIADQRRRLLLLAQKLGRGKLSKLDKSYLCEVLNRIGSGEVPDKVLGLRRTRGQKASDEHARRRMSLILHWVAGRIAPEPGSHKKAISIEKACEEALDTIVPAAKRMYPGADDREYDAQYLVRCWGAGEYTHMRKLERAWTDDDNPYA